jgi:hypothetical protein
MTLFAFRVIPRDSPFVEAWESVSLDRLRGSPSRKPPNPPAKILRLMPYATSDPDCVGSRCS